MKPPEKKKIIFKNGVLGKDGYPMPDMGDHYNHGYNQGLQDERNYRNWLVDEAPMESKIGAFITWYYEVKVKDPKRKVIGFYIAKALRKMLKGESNEQKN